jgi:Flp pilus assembly protein protease CpaA
MACWTSVFFNFFIVIVQCKNKINLGGDKKKKKNFACWGYFYTFTRVFFVIAKVIGGHFKYFSHCLLIFKWKIFLARLLYTPRVGGIRVFLTMRLMPPGSQI